MSLQSLTKLILACAAACLLSQCQDASTSTEAGEEPLAVVGGRAITADDLRAEAEWRKANNQFVPEPGTLLEEMVDRLALVERARQMGLAGETDTRRRIESLLIARLREQHLDPTLAALEVSDEELQAAYESRRQEFDREGMDRFSILFQAAHSKMSDEKRAEVRGRLESAIARADADPVPGGRGPAASGFGAVAIEYSDDQASRYRGGDIGWIGSNVDQTRFPEIVIETGRALESGARSGILEGDAGFYVIMKTDSRPGGVRPFEEVADGLRRNLQKEKRRELEQRFVADSLDLAEVEMNASAAGEINLPVSDSQVSRQDQPPGFPGQSRPTSDTR